MSNARRPAPAARKPAPNARKAALLGTAAPVAAPPPRPGSPRPNARKAALLGTAAPVAAPPAPSPAAPAPIGGTIKLGPRTYRLTAPTLAEVGGFLDQQAMSTAPTDADLQAAIREALAEAEGGTDALDTYETAEDRWVALTSIYILNGPEADPAIQGQAMQVRMDMLTARRRRDEAIAGIARHPSVLAIQAEQSKAQRRQRCELLALILRGWEGEGLPRFPDPLSAAVIEATLPVGDLASLGAAADALMQPTPIG